MLDECWHKMFMITRFKSKMVSFVLGDSKLESSTKCETPLVSTPVLCQVHELLDEFITRFMNPCKPKIH
jgi:hypothetical protein